MEIDAGDTYAYDEEGKKTQKAREEAAKERIYSLLPEDQKEELAAIFDEFEESKTPESKFAHAMDNLQPLTTAMTEGTGGNTVSAQSRFTAARAAQKKVLKNCMRLQIRS